MPRESHLLLSGTAELSNCIYPGEGGRDPLSLPQRPGRVAHAQKLSLDLSNAQQEKETRQAADEPNYDSEIVVLEFESEPEFLLKLESLDRRANQIELLNSRVENGIVHATVRVPENKLPILFGILEKYEKEDDPNSGKPKNQQLVESISTVRLAALPAFWTDSDALPTASESAWWEVWLSNVDSDGVAAFRVEAERIGLSVAEREIYFPERVVLVAQGTLVQISQYRGLFNVLAELRKAIEVPTAYLKLPAKDQGDIVGSALERIRPPASEANAVLVLDTGVNHGHGLLSIALNEEHVLACDPSWNAADADGHGTGMAGLALYGCLTEVFGNEDDIHLSHRLESVKVLPDHGENAPENYGAITAEAVALAELTSPERNRVICMAITASRLDEGEPTSWSAEIDQLAAGVDDDIRRLFIISAGNIRDELRHDDYTGANHLEGIEDPSQASNAVCVGAYTDKSLISSDEFDGYVAVGERGRLCPTSRTTIIWEATTWPLKPDIVMEGGNTACEAGGVATFIDDLVLLTTQVDESGAQFTYFCETSAATALASRMAARIQSRYPKFWPETIRGLLIHSARWTDEMVAEFPYVERQNRLKCYGHGVPNLERALWSASNIVTMVVQDTLQPYHKVGSDYRTKEMHFHGLPWPTDVLQGLGETPVSMKVTLSYFIEPSPGRRGWGYKHGYQSHGLRFDVKRPNESPQSFRERINRATWRDPDVRPPVVNDDRTWDLGDNLRTRGSLHADRWNGTAAQLAACGELAVYPVVGWWRLRQHLERYNKTARYSLVVTIETPSEEVDLYTPVLTAIAATTEVEAIQIEVSDI